MTRPDSRRFGRKPEGPLKIKLSTPAPAPSAPTGKTTRRVPKTTRRVADEDAVDTAAPVAFAAKESQARDQMVLWLAVGGGGFLLVLIIVIAVASSGSSGRAREEARRPTRKAAAEPPPPPPVERPKAHNFVRNTGSIVFVCAGTDKHPEREVVLSACPSCPAKNAFAWDDAAAGWRCTPCKAVYENAAIKCNLCDRPPRVTHLKKVTAGP